MMAFPEKVQELVSIAATYALDGAPFTAADRLHKAADALSGHAIAAGYPIPTVVQSKLKPLDADLAWALTDAENGVEFSAEYIGKDDCAHAEACRLETVLRRLAREAGYALPETVGGAS